LRYAKTPSVYYLHEPFGPSFQRAFRRPYIREEAWRRAANIVDPLPHLYWRKLYSLQRNSLLHTDLLLANSRFTQTQMYDDYGVTAPLCHYGVYLTDFRPLPDVAKGNHLLSVGALEPRKGFDFLVESLARIPAAERPPLSLACNEVDANERAYIEGIARQGGVELQILTNLSTSEMVLEYNKARLCVYSPVLEPLGLVPLEAMACGTPVIGVAEGGVSETVRDGETGLLVPRDPSAFAEAVRRLLSDPTTIDRFSAQAQAYVAREWSWDKSTALLESHLRSAAQHEFTALPTAIPETLQNVR
jgi:glycosyltransferase involved in cell wall biosynthesis